MEKKNVIDRRSIKLQDVMSKDYIPFLGGRPAREKVIGADDLLDLEIAINTSSTLDEFLSRI
jgi:hypothetical protein